jgi:hypothetical protein
VLLAPAGTWQRSANDLSELAAACALHKSCDMEITRTSLAFALVLVVGCVDQDHEPTTAAFVSGGPPPGDIDLVAPDEEATPAAANDIICDATGTCFRVGYSISCEVGSADCHELVDAPGENPQPGLHLLAWSAIDTATYTRSTTKAVKTSYSVQVGPVQRAGDELTNLQTKFEQTIKGYVTISHTLPVADWIANGKKPLIGAGGVLNYDVTATCGAETKLVNTTITADGEANTIALGFAGSLKLSASDGLIGGPDSTLLGFSVGTQRVSTVENGKTVELSIASKEEQTIALKIGDNPLKECQLKHFLKDAWGLGKNMMQSALDSAMNFLDAHGLKWTLTSTTPVVCKCSVRVDLYGKCGSADQYLWIQNGGVTEAVVQQFDEQAILQCASFSQGDKRQATVNGLVAQVQAWNADAHPSIDNTMLTRCNNWLESIHGPLGPRYTSAKVFKGADVKDRAITCAPGPNN